MDDRFQLLPVSTELREDPIPIRLPVTLVGRGRHCDLVIDRPSVSKVHAVFVADRDSFVVRDLLSTGGTRVRSRAVHEAVLCPGDPLRLGAFLFRFDGPSPPPRRPDRPVWISLHSAATAQRWRFKRRIILVGSQEGCDVVLARGDVSALHALIVQVDPQTVVVRKLTPGTRLALNGEPTDLAVLGDQDELDVGPVRLRLNVHQAAAAAHAADTAGLDAMEWSNGGQGDDLPALRDLPALSGLGGPIRASAADEPWAAVAPPRGVANIPA